MCKIKFKKSLAELFFSFEIDISSVDVELTRDELEEQLHMKEQND